jgi:hypothetical protein
MPPLLCSLYARKHLWRAEPPNRIDLFRSRRTGAISGLSSTIVANKLVSILNEIAVAIINIGCCLVDDTGTPNYSNEESDRSQTGCIRGFRRLLYVLDDSNRHRRATKERRPGIRTRRSNDKAPNHAPGTLDSYGFPHGRSLSSRINQFLLGRAFPLGTLAPPSQSLLLDTWVLHQW